MPRKMHIYKEIRGTIEDLISLQGIVEVEKRLGIIVMGVRHTGIENIRTGV